MDARLWNLVKGKGRPALACEDAFLKAWAQACGAALGDEPRNYIPRPRLPVGLRNEKFDVQLWAALWEGQHLPAGLL